MTGSSEKFISLETKVSLDAAVKTCDGLICGQLTRNLKVVMFSRLCHGCFMQQETLRHPRPGPSSKYFDLWANGRRPEQELTGSRTATNKISCVSPTQTQFFVSEKVIWKKTCKLCVTISTEIKIN